MTKTYAVEGIQDDAAAASVAREVSEVPGIQDVDVERESGRVVVSGHGFVDAQVEEAIISAGFALRAAD